MGQKIHRPKDLVLADLTIPGSAGTAYLNNPLVAAELANAVRKVLDGKR